jgi:hypothetical protein
MVSVQGSGVRPCPRRVRLFLVSALVLLDSCVAAHDPHPTPTGPAATAVAAPVVASPSPAMTEDLPPPAPVPPPPPPYDLAADRDRIVAEAKRDLGEGARTVVADDVFVLIGAPGWGGSALAESLKLTRDALAAYFHGRFRTKPSRALAVYLFPNARPYHVYCRAQWNEDCISHFGFYMPSERKLIMDAGPGLGTLTHELVHPIVEEDFPSAPTWINEGIASLYEAPVVYAPGEIRGVKNWRLPRLIRALASPEERGAVRLDALFGMPDETFRGRDEDRNYATARYACQWLDHKKALWPFYQRWRDQHVADPTGEKSFAEVVGRSPAEATAEWVAWVKAL